MKKVTTHYIFYNKTYQNQDFYKGNQVYSKLQNKRRATELDNIFIDFYGNFGDIDTAQNIFNNIDDNEKTFVSINTMIKIYIEHGLYETALEIYDKYEPKHNHTSHILAIHAH